VLLVDDELREHSASGRASRAIVEDLKQRGVEVVTADSAADGAAVVASDASLQAVLVDWSLGGDDPLTHAGALALLRLARSRNPRLPVFLMAERQDAAAMSLEAMQVANEFVWMLEDTAEFVAGRVLAAMRRYAAGLLPPMTDALLRFAEVREHSWAAPGHQGGVAFLKSPVGRVFFDYLGENAFRADLGIERGLLGSLLDHTGPIGAGERYAAKVFGAHRTYSVTNGTSGSNRIVMSACLGEGRIALCDRNCHKSIEHGLALTGGVPVWLQPMRNRYGIIGPVPAAQLEPAALHAAIAASPLARDLAGRAQYAVLTNCTYDGVCYDAERAEQLLGASADRLHFDEAWYGYARFHPLYAGRHAMRGNPAGHEGPTIVATQSTHKMLAALSQASLIHVRDGRGALEHRRFNEAFMMHGTTSPLYSIVASNEVAASMMDGEAGAALVAEAVREAVAFRQTLARFAARFAAAGDWSFTPWNAPDVFDPARGERVPFAEASPELLCADPRCWLLEPGAPWHGFEGLEAGWAMLDPVKVGVVTPGLGADGVVAADGLPAPLLAAYLDRHGITAARTTDFMVLFLFSIGITKGKWGTLVNVLLEFKRDVDANVPLAEALPAIVATDPARYAGLGLRDLAAEMCACLRETRRCERLEQAFSALPAPVLTPRRAYQSLVDGAVESVPLSALAGRVLATGVIPYPPGIPLLMPGESAGAASGPHLAYLHALRAWQRRFPGFTPEIQGVEIVADDYRFLCLRP
jgi:arginine/lysine/ornithine decarboxylase